MTVAPFSHGETPLQHYNSLLCLHHLQTQADGIILFQNDHVLAQTLKSIGLASKSVPATSQASRPARAMASSASGTHSGSSGSVSVEDMNRYMSSVICNTLLPVWSAKQKLVSFVVCVVVVVGYGYSGNRDNRQYDVTQCSALDAQVSLIQSSPTEW